MTCDYKLFAGTDVDVILKIESGFDLENVEDLIVTLQYSDFTKQYSLLDNTVIPYDQDYMLLIKKEDIVEPGTYKIKILMKTIDDKERGITACPDILKFN